MGGETKMNGDRALILPADISIPGAYYKGRKDAFKEVLEDLKEFELKRYSDMNRTLAWLREKYEE